MAPKVGRTPPGVRRQSTGVVQAGAGAEELEELEELSEDLLPPFDPVFTPASEPLPELSDFLEPLPSEPAPPEPASAPAFCLRLSVR